MQLTNNTTQKRFSLRLKNLGTKTAALTFIVALSAAGLLATSDVYAKDQTTQASQSLASNNNPHSVYVSKRETAKHQAKQQNKSTSDDNNNRLGGYSLQDGAMQGPYGDGEYAD